MRAASTMFLASALLAVATALAWGGEPSSAKIDALLNDMLARGAQFPPERLDALGPDGFAAVLDWIFPETAVTEEVELPDAVVGTLIADLGSDNYQRREAATRRLRELGPGARRAVTRAAQSGDAEVSWRAVRVLRAWEDDRNDDMSRFAPAMTACLVRLDDAPRLEELARRVRAVLDLGVPGGGKMIICREAIVTLYRTKDDRYLNELKPLLEHANSRVPIFVIQGINYGIGREGGATTFDPFTGRVVTRSGIASAGSPPPEPGPPPFCPALLLDALQSPRAEIVQAALPVIPKRVADDVLPELEKRLEKIFEMENETLKLLVCQPLIALYDHAGAIDYALAEAQQTNNNSRRYQALRLLVNPNPPSRPIPAKMRDALADLLKQNTLGSMRVSVVSAIGGYAGEDVIAALVPLLADNYQPVQREASRRLLQQPDKKALREALAKAAGDGDNTTLQHQAQQVLEQLEAQE